MTSLQSIVLRATEATITMPVAAENPPRKASRAIAGALRDHECIGVHRFGEGRKPGNGDRHHQNAEDKQIAGIEPGGRARLRQRLVLHHCDMKHMRKAKERDRGDDCIRHPGRVGEIRRQQRRHGRVRLSAGDEIPEPVEHPEDDEQSNEDESRELDQAFEGDRGHQAAMVLACVDMPDAEHDGEERHRDGNRQGAVAADRPIAARWQRRRRQYIEAGADGLQLKRNIGQDGEQSGHGDERRERLALAVARGDEVGDRSDVLALRDRYHLRNQPLAENKYKRRADIDRKEVQAAQGAPDRAVEAPGGVVDGERQRVAECGRPPGRNGQGAAFALPVRPPRDQEEYDDIDRGNGEDEPTGHDTSLPNRGSSRGAAVGSNAIMPRQWQRDLGRAA
jgi:hypothetical protein